VSFSPILALYRAVSVAAGPFGSMLLNARARSGKEDPERLNERYGRYARPRPSGALVWLHGASVGESGVALQIADAMAARDPWLSFLISSGTRTSADFVAKRAGVRARHIYAPIDRPDAVKRFLKHWRPDLGVFVESEVWPNLILAARGAGVPLALVNARMSPKSLKRWSRWDEAGRRIFGAFDLALAADQRTADALTRLRGAKTPALGNLKLGAEPPGYSDLARAALSAQIGARPVWLAASTHAGEEEILFRAQERLRESHPDALLVIVPRHPARGEEVATLANGAPRRSLNQPVGAASVYIADTLGELGLFYAAIPVAFVAGSLRDHLKGHNPIEPAKLGSAIITGPHVESFEDIFEALFAADAAIRVTTIEDIVPAVTGLWSDTVRRTRMRAAAREIVAQGAGALDATVDQLCALLPAPAAADASADASA
jgi:3-deoxy-D-manno-octulosonic-acid transferase